MRKCVKCKERLALDAFSWKNQKKGWRHSWCRECQKVYRKQHYLDNKDRCKSQTAAGKAQRAAAAKKYVWQYLLAHPCVDCGESDPVVLEFDHQDPSTKDYNVSAMVSGSYTLETVKREISKCDVRCANCHRRKTAHDYDGWKLKF